MKLTLYDRIKKMPLLAIAIAIMVLPLTIFLLAIKLIAWALSETVFYDL